MMIACDFNCQDVVYQRHFMQVDLKTAANIRLVMISEACPVDLADYFDGGENSRFLRNTNQAFKGAGYEFHTFEDYLQAGIYLTTAIKCAKQGYLVSSQTLENCSNLLEMELGQFPNVKVMLLMGDFAIKAVNAIYKRRFKTRVIPAGSTYKIRGGVFEQAGVRFFPSYTQTGDSYGIEKSKVKMIEEDIKAAMRLLQSLEKGV